MFLCKTEWGHMRRRLTVIFVLGTFALLATSSTGVARDTGTVTASAGPQLAEWTVKMTAQQRTDFPGGPGSLTGFRLLTGYFEDSDVNSFDLTARGSYELRSSFTYDGCTDTTTATGSSSAPHFGAFFAGVDSNYYARDPAAWGLAGDRQWTPFTPIVRIGFPITTGRVYACRPANSYTETGMVWLPFPPLFLPGTYDDLDALPVGHRIQMTYSWRFDASTIYTVSYEAVKAAATPRSAPAPAPARHPLLPPCNQSPESYPRIGLWSGSSQATTACAVIAVQG